MRRRKFTPHLKTNQTFGLNITSMTDMFTILLVFLLQTYSTSEIEIIPEKGLNLPTSNSEVNPVASLQVTLSTKELKVQDRVIASLKETDFSGSDVDPHDSNFITPLFKELDRIAKEEKDKPKPNPGIIEGRLLVQADASLSYGVLRKVMYTASMAGFPKLKMATVVGE